MEFDESTYKRDMLMMRALEDCCLSKAVRFRPIKEGRYYFFTLGKDNFSKFAVSYPRVDNKFDVATLKLELLTRFVELLAPLTLYHLRKSSKSVYFHCLDVRGLEYSSVHHTAEPVEHGTPLCFSGFSGMLSGPLIEGDFRNYQICQDRLDIRSSCHGRPYRLNFVKKYRILELGFDPKEDVQDVHACCSAALHPGVEHLDVSFCENLETPRVYVQKSLTALLGYCRNVKNLSFYFHPESFGDQKDLLGDDPKLTQLTKLVETFAIQASRLEVFILKIHPIILQLVDKKLKRCVARDGVWYWIRTGFHLDHNFDLCICADMHLLLPYYMTGASLQAIMSSKRFQQNVAECGCRRFLAGGIKGRYLCWKYRVWLQWMIFTDPIRVNFKWYFCTRH